MLAPANDETMVIERRANGVAVVTVNRPERLSAVNGCMCAELATFSRDCANGPQMRVLVPTGGGRAFCADGDFGPGDPIGSNPADPTMLVEARRIVDHILECEKPPVAAVNGYAMGLGANLALLCDVVVAVDKALEVSDRLAAGPPQAIAASKMAVNAYLRSVSNQVMLMSLQCQAATTRSEDHREAVRACQEKRAPNFTGP